MRAPVAASRACLAAHAGAGAQLRAAHCGALLTASFVRAVSVRGMCHVACGIPGRGAWSQVCFHFYLLPREFLKIQASLSEHPHMDRITLRQSSFLTDGLETVPDPAEQVPLVARSVTPPSPPTSPSEMMERGDDTARSTLCGPSAACTSILYRVCYDPPPMNTPVREGETIEGSRTMRNLLKCSTARQARTGHQRGMGGRRTLDR